MSTPEIIDIGSNPSVEVFALDPAEIAAVTVTGGGSSSPGAQVLDDLADVQGATDGSPGQVLTKGGDGIWVPATVTGGGGPVILSYTHVQDEPSTVWLIGHGLPFQPAGIEVYDAVGNRYYPNVTWVDDFTVRLDFGDSVRGTARLS